MKLKNYIYNLLFDDQPLMEISTADYYAKEIIEELKHCKITQKSVEEIYLHEFKTYNKKRNSYNENNYILTVSVIYNGDFEHQFNIYRKENK